MSRGTTAPIETVGDKTDRRNQTKDKAELKYQARRLADHCKAFSIADPKRGVIQLIVTVLPFAGLVAAMLASVAFEYYWLSALLTVPAAGLLVRLFIIQHDCGHGSFFRSRAANDLLGRIIGLMTITPYSDWRRAHAVHHATSGNLDRRGVGDVSTLTVAEYRALSKFRRLSYRLYRNPLIHLVIGPPYNFFLRQRIPFGSSAPFGETWRSAVSLNVAIAAVYGGFVLFYGFETLLIVYFPIIVVASWIGGWMFFIQHQYENTYWESEADWDFHVSALLGSSYYVLPKFLNWFTGNIGLHHIHHLCGKVPNYRLQECLRASPELQRISRLTLVDSLKCVRLALWDEEQHRMVGFRSLKTAATGLSA